MVIRKKGMNYTKVERGKYMGIVFLFSTCQPIESVMLTNDHSYGNIQSCKGLS